MSQSFKTHVNNKFHFEINVNDIQSLDVIPNGDTKSHVLHNNKSFHTEIKETDFKKKTYTVIVNNNHYQVQILNELDLLIQDMGFSLGAIKHVNSIIAPMPGLILDILVNVGDIVQENDNLLILEAMKMENIITAPRNGVIKTIEITKGTSVDKNELLIEFE